MKHRMKRLKYSKKARIGVIVGIVTGVVHALGIVVINVQSSEVLSAPMSA